MHIVKLDATDSTNVYLKDLMLSQPLEDYTVVLADNQLKGRGQMGTSWIAEPGKNLTFSILKHFKSLSVSNSFLLHICISKAIHACLMELKVPELSVKWANDIMSGKSKICGILIENVLAGSRIKSSIIGIGLNVNQIDFGTVENASSLKLLLGQNFNLDDLLNLILEEIQKAFKNLETLKLEEAIADYESILFRKDRLSTFENEKDEVFTGFIRGVASSGKLKVETEQHIQKEYDIKEIKLLY